MIVTYLLLVDAGKRVFYRSERRGAPLAIRRPQEHRRIRRLSTRWTHPSPVRRVVR
jgi:hypothetical protein